MGNKKLMTSQSTAKHGELMMELCTILHGPTVVCAWGKDVASCKMKLMMAMIYPDGRASTIIEYAKRKLTSPKAMYDLMDMDGIDKTAVKQIYENYLMRWEELPVLKDSSGKLSVKQVHRELSDYVRRYEEPGVVFVRDGYGNILSTRLKGILDKLALNSRPFSVKILNDYNAHIANFWKVATDPETNGQLLNMVWPIYCGQSDFEKAKLRREIYGSNRADKIVWAADTFYLNRNSFNRKGDYWTDVKVSDRSTAQRSLEVSFQLLMGQRFQVFNRNALVMLKESGVLDDPTTFIYLDPPYLEGLRCNGQLYRVDMPDTRDHINLLKAIQPARAKIILSGYWSGQDDGTDLYDFYLQGWQRDLLGEYTKGIAPGDRKAKGKEYIWMNY